MVKDAWGEARNGEERRERAPKVHFSTNLFEAWKRGSEK